MAEQCLELINANVIRAQVNAATEQEYQVYEDVRKKFFAFGLAVAIFNIGLMMDRLFT